MPYTSNAQLPAPLRKRLPRHAQEINRAAFNDAYEHYGAEHEAIAHRIACSREAALRSARGRRLGRPHAGACSA
ncbi:MAG: ChaB family protein [Kofleriaceae bacterium]